MNKIALVSCVIMLNGCASQRVKAPELEIQEEPQVNLTPAETQKLVKIYRACDKALTACQVSQEKLEAQIEQQGPHWYDYIVPAIIGLLLGLAIHY
jgi:hypothetical protein